MPTYASLSSVREFSDLACLGGRRRACVLATCLIAATAMTGCPRNPFSPTPEEEPATASLGMQYIDQANEQVRAGNVEEALRDFERAIEVNPNLTQAHMGMGDIYRMQGDYERAEEKYGKAAEITPRDFDAQFYHGLMLHMLDRVREAIGAYVRALSIRPDDFRATLNLATAYYQLDENAKALEFGQRAVNLNPRDGAARFNLGSIYAAMGRHNDAIVEYQQAAELLPLTPELLMNLADSLGKEERFAEMRTTLAEVIRSEPTAAAYERLGFAEFRMKNYDASQKAFQDALTLEPNYFPALNGLGVCLLNRWHWSGKSDLTAKDQGVAALRRSLQIEPSQPRIVELLSRYGV